MIRRFALGLACLVFCAAITIRAKGGPMSLQLSTTAFSNGGTIPKQYTCDGPDLSPPLSWSGAPSGTQSFALIADDPDAPVGTWVHWVLYNAPAGSSELAEDTPKSQYLPGGAKQGLNDFQRLG